MGCAGVIVYGTATRRFGLKPRCVRNLRGGKVLRKHVDQNTLQRIVDELLDTRGDTTFRDTIEQLAHDLNVMR